MTKYLDDRDPSPSAEYLAKQRRQNSIDGYVSVSKWGMFRDTWIPPKMPVHEPEVRDAIRAKHKLFEGLHFNRVERIMDLKA